MRVLNVVQEKQEGAKVVSINEMVSILKHYTVTEKEVVEEDEEDPEGEYRDELLVFEGEQVEYEVRETEYDDDGELSIKIYIQLNPRKVEEALKALKEIKVDYPFKNSPGFYQSSYTGLYLFSYKSEEEVLDQFVSCFLPF
jgi:hypothetical protein